MDFNRAYNRTDFVNFVRTEFLPEDYLENIKTETPDGVFKYSHTVTKIGECKSLELDVFEIKHTSSNDARVSLSKESFRILSQCSWNERALIAFVPEDNPANYRISLVCIDRKWEGDRKTKEYSNPRRYSYFLGEGIGTHTPDKYLKASGRVTDFKDLQTRFSVEVLTKAFYNELSDWYAWAIKIIRFPNNISNPADDAAFNNESAIRLITRLIFVWFLKQKHLIPEEFFDENYISTHLLKDFEPNLQTGLFLEKSVESKYYKAILQNLFFAMLNSPITPEGKNTISERRFSKGRQDFDNNKLMRYKDKFINPDLFIEIANKTVPFLNGGLFDCLDEKDKGLYYDGFSEREVVQRSLIVPDYLFFGEEVGRNTDLSGYYGDARKKRVNTAGIIDILKRYNFTVEENTPSDQEISLDPELLGKVFENLLASYNPETQSTARKQTGSFYTPREIVQYMVDESLVAHLKRTVGDNLEDEYRKLMRYTDEPVSLTKDQKLSIMHSLYDCKILDPACGSGAFPMGALQQMVHILSQLDPDNEQWKNILMENAISETSEAYQNATDEERKEMVMDIERSFNDDINRPDYARKLYLVEHCIFGVDIQSIAVQISKLRFFISLVVDQITNNNPVDNFGIRPLPNLEAKFVAANTLIGLKKNDTTLFDSDAIQTLQDEMMAAKHKIFGAKTHKTKMKYKSRVTELRLQIANLLKDSGVVGNEEAKQMAGWDMFDQNASSPFFDPEWMFGLSLNNGGYFDIVIGNPPWGADLSASDKVTLKAMYPEIDSSTPNSFAYFIGFAYRLYKSSLNFVLPDSILIKDFAKTRGLLKDKLSEVIWYENSGVPELLRPFVYVDHDVCVINIISTQCEYAIYKTNSYSSKCNSIIISQATVHKRDVITPAFENVYNLKANSHDYSLLSKIQNYRPIGQFMQCHEGIHTGNIREKLFIRTPNKYSHPLYYGGGAGDTIDKYHSNTSGWYVDYRHSLIDKHSGQYASLRDEHIFSLPKIYITRTGNPFKAFYDDTTYASNNFFSLQFSDYSKNSKESLLCILPFINSRLCQYFIRTFAAPRLGSTFVETKIYHLLKFPIPEISIDTRHLFLQLVNEILESKIKGNNANTDKQEADINAVIYSLYGINEDEIAIIEGK